MARIHLHRKLIQRRIDERFGGSAAQLAELLGLHRSTVSRWLGGENEVFPRSEDAVIALAAALDLDPCLLWDVSPTEYPRLLAQIKGVAKRGAWSRLLPSLGFLEGFVDASDDWPPGELAAQFHRPWHVSDFEHDPDDRSSYYGAFTLASAPGQSYQVWHIASRIRRGPRPSPWEPLGLVTRIGSSVRLYAGNGVMMERKGCCSRPDGCVVETWFGERHRVFRIASLHAFSASIEPDPRAAPDLRFCLVGRSCDRQSAGGTPCKLAKCCNAYRPSAQH
jgi:transcriptional regulator with XRE-family HTH domain